MLLLLFVTYAAVGAVEGEAIVVVLCWGDNLAKKWNSLGLLKVQEEKEVWSTFR